MGVDSVFSWIIFSVLSIYGFIRFLLMIAEEDIRRKEANRESDWY